MIHSLHGNGGGGQAAGPVSGGRKPRPQPQSWMGYSMVGPASTLERWWSARSDRSGRNYTSRRPGEGILPPTPRTAANHWAGARLSYPLEWEELPTRRDCRISVYMTDVDPEDERDWPRQHEWLTAKINDFHRVFLARVRDLDAEDWKQDSEVDVSAGASQVPR